MPWILGMGAITAGAAYLKKDEHLAECASSFTDKNLDEIMQKINNGVDDLYKKHP